MSTKILHLIQFPGHLPENPNLGWMIRDPERWGYSDQFRTLTAEEAPRPWMYKVLQHVPGYPAEITAENTVEKAMTPFLIECSLKKIEDHLAGRLKEASGKAIEKLPYENSLWILKATPEELESWAITLAALMDSGGS